MGHSRAERAPHLSSPSWLESSVLPHGNPSATTAGTHILVTACRCSTVPQEERGTKLRHICATLHPPKRKPVQCLTPAMDRKLLELALAPSSLHTPAQAPGQTESSERLSGPLTSSLPSSSLTM